MSAIRLFITAKKQLLQRNVGNIVMFTCNREDMRLMKNHTLPEPVSSRTTAGLTGYTAPSARDSAACTYPNMYQSLSRIS